MSGDSIQPRVDDGEIGNCMWPQMELPVPLDDITHLRELAAAIRNEAEVARRYAATIANDGAGALSGLFVRVHHERERAVSGFVALLRHRQAALAVQAMLADPGKDWSLDELASRANASRSTLVRVFRKVANMAPLKLLMELRLELARRKLWATDLTLAQIAYEIGYQSESAFSRAFRRRFGMPPRQAARRFGLSQG
jgi:AraC family transcriptional activator of mtrCDE